MFRFILPSAESEFLKVNDKGELQGPHSPIIREVYIYLVSKLNLTWITVDKSIKRADDIEIEGLEMLKNDQADAEYSVLKLLSSGLHGNVSAGSIMHVGWCKMASSPVLASTVLMDGPESSLWCMRMEFFVPILIILFLMIHYTQMILNSNDRHQSGWILFASLTRQQTQPMLMRSSRMGFMVLLLSTMLIQIMYGSFLHTETTSINSFIRIDSIDEATSRNMNNFILDISTCSKIMSIS